MSNKANAASILYKTKVEASIGSIKLAVSGARLNLSINSVPYIVLTVGAAPVEDEDSANSTIITSHVDVVKFNEKLSTYVGKAVCRFSIEVCQISTGYSQRVDCKHWILLGTGLQDMSGDGKLGLKVVLVHPAAILQSGSLITVTKDTRNNTVTNQSNFPAALKSALDQWLISQQRFIGNIGQRRESLELSKKVIDYYDLVLDYSKAPGIGSILSVVPTVNYVDELVATINMAGTSTVWQLLLDKIIGSTGLIIIPTYDKQRLQIIGDNIWADSGTVYHMEYIDKISMSVSDPSPILGVTMIAGRGTGNDRETYTTGILNNESPDVPGSYTVMTGKVDYYNHLGKVERVAAPWWIRSAISPQPKPVEIDEDRYTHNITSSSAAPSTDPGSALGNIIEKACKAHLYTRYKKNTTISFTSVPSLKIHDNTVYPGSRITLAGTDTSMYTNEVDHIIDVGSGTATTRWRCSFVDTDGSSGYLGEKNPLHT